MQEHLQVHANRCTKIYAKYLSITGKVSDAVAEEVKVHIQQKWYEKYLDDIANGVDDLHTFRILLLAFGQKFLNTELICHTITT